MNKGIKAGLYIGLISLMSPAYSGKPGHYEIEFEIYNETKKPVNVEVFDKTDSKYIDRFESFEVQQEPEITVQNIQPEETRRIEHSLSPQITYEINAYNRHGKMEKPIRSTEFKFRKNKNKQSFTVEIGRKSIKVSNQADETPNKPLYPNKKNRKNRSNR